MTKLLRLLAILACAAVAATAMVHFVMLPDKPMRAPEGMSTAAVKIVMPIDLSGKWESEKSRAGTKMVAEIKDKTIHVEMVVADGYTGLWYGTFDVLQPGQAAFVSKAINDPNHLVLSSAEEKQFIYQGDNLVFDYSVMGTRTTVAMKRV